MNADMVFWTREDSFAAGGRRRPHTPGVRQGKHAECGLAALVILFGRHSLHVPMTNPCREAGSALFCSPVRQLRDLAQSGGFEARVHGAKLIPLADPRSRSKRLTSQPPCQTQSELVP